MFQGHACITVAKGKPIRQFDQYLGKHSTSEQESRTAALSPKLKSFICTMAVPTVILHVLCPE